jgi:exoribonuclease R
LQNFNKFVSDRAIHYLHHPASIIRGERTNKIYKIGQKIKVEVIAASKQMRTVDFRLKNEETD